MVIANHSLASFFQNRLQYLPFLAILVPSRNEKLFRLPDRCHFADLHERLEMYCVNANIMIRTNVEDGLITCGS